jgi:enoyl-CoA hydratase/carnithine racemase
MGNDGGARLRMQAAGSEAAGATGGAGLVGEAVLDRPGALNSLDTATLTELARHFTALGRTSRSAS